MIPLHRITQPDREFFLNPDLIQTVEATPDTVIALTNGTKFVVAEPAEAVAALVRDWHAGIISAAETDPPAARPNVLRFPTRPN